MAEGYVQLQLGTDSVTISRFVKDGALYPRKRQVPAELTRSAYGVLTQAGRFTEPFFTWEIECFVALDDWPVLKSIEFRQDELKRAFADAKILLIDTTQPIVELAPRSRALLAAPWNAVTPVSTDSVQYYTAFYVYWAGEAEPMEIFIDSEIGPCYRTVLKFEESSFKTTP